MLEGIPISFSPVQGKDFALGFFIALALRQGRLRRILDTILPTDDDQD